MKGRTWLWIAVAVLALISVCCLGLLIGGALGRREATVARATAGVSTQPAVQQPTAMPTAGSTEPTLPPPPSPTLVPTLPPPPSPTPTLVPTLPPPPTATAYPIPPPPSVPPAAPPADSDLQALVDYANAMQPLLVEAGELVKRDGEILEASEGGNDAVLCDGRLAADNAAMADVLRRVRAITPPADAVAIHDLALSSGDAWTEALDNVQLFCNSGQHLYKIPAVLKFWEAAATLQDAANRFWLLLIANGVEDWVQR